MEIFGHTTSVQPAPHLPVHADRNVSTALQTLATQRLVFFAGLPGTGKSFLSHQLAHLAHAAGRTIHLLQWDVARPVFESSPAGQAYPVIQGVTHGLIRLAVGRWARHAIAQWQQRYGAPQHLLIGETPFVGNRLMELARPVSDPAEALLCDAACCFVIPVPSRTVRHYIEQDRQHRATNPLHAREREDAPPHVLRALWAQLVQVATMLGLSPAAATTTDGAAVPYDPVIYQRVYEALLAHRHTYPVPVDTVLPTKALSVYDFTVPTYEVVPTAEEVTHFMHDTATQYADAAVLQQHIEQWYRLE
jgi:hypothetical protein